MTTTTQSNYVKEFTPAQFKSINRTLLKYFQKNGLKYIDNNQTREIKTKAIYSYSQLDNILGLAYTSSGDCAGLWICNGVEVPADETHNYIGFTFNEDGDLIGLAWDNEEKEISVNISEAIK